MIAAAKEQSSFAMIIVNRIKVRPQMTELSTGGVFYAKM